MSSSKKFCLCIITSCLVLSWPNPVQSGETCGGILEGDDGRHSNPTIAPGSTCIWTIKLLSTSTLLFQLTGLGLDSTVNLYPEHDPSQSFFQPITFGNANVTSKVETVGQTLVVILVQGQEEAGVSFSWGSVSLVPPKRYDFASANYVEQMKGSTAWANLKDRQSLVWTLNGKDGRSVSMETDVQFVACPLINPCDCSYFGAYEVISGGFLREIYRVCGRPLRFDQSELSPKIVMFVYINYSPPIGQLMGSAGSLEPDLVEVTTNSVQITWTSEDDDAPTTTTTTTTTMTTEPPTETTESTEGPPKPVTCPIPNTIFPCTCESVVNGNLEISCEGSAITQSLLNRTMDQLRLANDLTSPDQWLTLYTFRVTRTPIVKLNLACFFNTRILNVFNIGGNKQLTLIHGGDDAVGSRNGQEEVSGQIDVFQLTVSVNSVVTDDGLQDFFFYFTPNLEKFYMSQDLVNGGSYDIGDGSGDIEFFPGISRFTQLRIFSYRYSLELVHVAGGQFKRIRNLREISMLAILDGYIQLGQDAFVMEPPDTAFEDGEFLQLSLSSNQYNDSSFDPPSEAPEGALVLWGTNRPTNLDLTRNNFEFFSQQNFQPFLDEDERNVVNAIDNSFVCDERMRWLKEGRDRYQFRVFGVICTNDPGEDVFTTSLIP